MVASQKSAGQTQIDELRDTFQAIEMKFRATLTGEQLEDMLGQLQGARCLIELAVKGNADGNNMLICANAVMLHLRSRIEVLRGSETDRAAMA